MKTVFFIKFGLAMTLLCFGINKFIPFLPEVTLEFKASELKNALIEARYCLPLLGLMEVLCGVLLFRKNTTPFALILLTPISVNGVLFYLFLDVTNIWPALFVLVSNFILLYFNRDFYSPVLLSITNGKLLIKKKLKEYNLSYSK